MKGKSKEQERLEGKNRRQRSWERKIIATGKHGGTGDPVFETNTWDT
jgi:hypothetical protein